MHRAVFAALLLPGCFVYLSAEPTTASDGAPAWKINCKPEQSICLSKAAALCPHGYTTLESNETYEYVGQGGIYRIDMLVECNDAHAPVVAAGPPKCFIAYQYVDDLVKLWSDWYQKEPAADVPSRGLFLTACYELNDKAQHCLVPSFGNAHREDCLVTLAPFAQTRAKLDALLSKP
jgi:hypothetical protein